MPSYDADTDEYLIDDHTIRAFRYLRLSAYMPLSLLFATLHIFDYARRALLFAMSSLICAPLDMPRRAPRCYGMPRVSASANASAR